MKSNKKKLLVICPSPIGYAPGQRLKYEQYFEHWRNNGYDIDVQPFISEEFQKIVYQKGFFFSKVIGVLSGYVNRIKLFFRLSDYDLVYCFLWVTPFGPPIFERLYIQRIKRMVYDIDDLIFLKMKEYSPLKGYKKPFVLMKKADHIITCTPYLDEKVRQYNPNTTDISSTINTSIYIPKTDYKQKEEKLVIGWSGSHSTVRQMAIILPTLKKIRETIDFKFVVMGTDSLEYDGLDIEAIPWSASYEVDVIKRFDIGIYPLPNEEYMLGKSSLKALQYMSLGIPTVATALGTNYRVIEDGISGFLAKDDNDWIDMIIRLAKDENLRKQIGQNAAHRVETKFSVRANEKTYLDILDKVSSKP